MSTLQSDLTYDDFQPKLETKMTPESHLLLIHLPGFEREHIGAKFEFDYRRVRVFGARPLGDNRFNRFNIAYPVPVNCDVNNLKGKFEGGIYSVIMPKKVILREVPKELKPTEQEAPKSPIQKTEPKPEMVQEAIPPKSTTAVEQERTTAADQVEAEKGKVEISQEPKQKIESKKQADETLTPPKATSDSMPQKGQQGIPQKLTSTRDSIHQTEDKFVGAIAENGEKQRVEKKETKEDSREISASEKPPQKDVMDDSATEMENKKETKESAESEKGKGKEKEMNGKYSDNEGIPRKGMTSLLERFKFNEQDKQMLIYTSATVLVVAVGVYVSYKLRSSARS